jgi:deazaflavin-dependent oxidoreductase (nitroreductase family)
VTRRHTPFFLKPVEAFIASPWGGPIFIKLVTPVDRWLIPATNGRISVLVGQPIVVLETIGARSGERRRTPLLHIKDGDRIVLIASFVGKPRNPAWYHNLKANPRVRVFTRGATGWYTAHEAEGEERKRLWQAACDFYGGYEKYQTRTGGRTIPVMVLTPEARAMPSALTTDN